MVFFVHPHIPQDNTIQTAPRGPIEQTLNIVSMAFICFSFFFLLVLD